MEINNVIICGLGALGLTYANKLKGLCTLKVLADIERIKNYRAKAPIFNNQPLELEYILPQENFNADLIIISTKSVGLDTAIEFIRNFVTPKTIIISLINGVSSEEKIQKAYPNSKVLKSYFIGHSAMVTIQGDERKYFQDGFGKVVFEPNEVLEKFFSQNSIDYEVREDIIYAQWVKLGVNIVLNEFSAIHNCNVGELRKRSDFVSSAKKMLEEVKEVADALGIKGLENYEQEVLSSVTLVADDGKTSMLQDIMMKRKTEVDIFSGEIIELGKIFGIKTPHNEVVYNKIKEIERNYL